MKLGDDHLSNLKLPIPKPRELGPEDVGELWVHGVGECVPSNRSLKECHCNVRVIRCGVRYSTVPETGPLREVHACIHVPGTMGVGMHLYWTPGKCHCP